MAEKTKTMSTLNGYEIVDTHARANKIDKPSTAEVGQTIVVKAVDESGIPTEWEAVDFPKQTQADLNQNDSSASDYVKNRTHWIEMFEDVAIIPETTVTIGDEGAELEAVIPIDFVEGETYKIVWGGTTYNSVLQLANMEGVIYYCLGDLYTATGGAMGSAATGEPFCIVMILMDTNSYYVSIIPFEELSSITFSVYSSSPEEVIHYLDPKYIEEMYRTETVNVAGYPETTFADVSETITLTSTPHISDGANYTVMWNGVLYECVGSVIAKYGLSYIGNLGVADIGSNTGEPFLIITNNNDTSAIYFNDGSTTVTMSYTGTLTKIKKIDAKYLPEVETQIKNLSDGSSEGSLRTSGSAEDSTKYTIGKFAFAAGKNTNAIGEGSHAEGYSSIASGAYSHAEGYSSIASGAYSHAEGYSSIASGAYSHAEGYQTKASSKNQHVQGKYNKIDSDGKYAHIIGNGTGASKLSNAHTVDWDGNAWYSGDVYIGGSGQDDTENVKKLATEDYIRIHDLTLPERCAVLCYGNDKIICMGNKKFYYSTDGVTWTAISRPSELNTPNDCCYADNKFVAITNNTNYAYYSEDGIKWTKVVIVDDSVTRQWRSICYGDGKFVATANDGTYAYSEDGVNWTAASFPEYNDGANIAQSYITYGNNIFVASLGNGSIYYSTDGQNWVINSSVQTTSSSMELYYYNGEFVGIDNKTCYKSEDGINWNSYAIQGTDAYLRYIFYDGIKYVGVSAYGIVCISDDCIDWIEYLTLDGYTIYETLYANGIFILVNHNSPYNYVLSRDGKIWRDKVVLVNDEDVSDSLFSAINGLS